MLSIRMSFVLLYYEKIAFDFIFDGDDDGLFTISS